MAATCSKKNTSPNAFISYSLGLEGRNHTPLFPEARKEKKPVQKKKGRTLTFGVLLVLYSGAEQEIKREGSIEGNSSKMVIAFIPPRPLLHGPDSRYTHSYTCKLASSEWEPLAPWLRAAEAFRRKQNIPPPKKKREREKCSSLFGSNHSMCQEKDLQRWVCG